MRGLIKKLIRLQQRTSVEWVVLQRGGQDAVCSQNDVVTWCGLNDRISDWSWMHLGYVYTCVWSCSPVIASPERDVTARCDWTHSPCAKCDTSLSNQVTAYCPFSAHLCVQQHKGPVTSEDPHLTWFTQTVRDCDALCLLSSHWRDILKRHEITFDELRQRQRLQLQVLITGGWCILIQPIYEWWEELHYREGAERKHDFKWRDWSYISLLQLKVKAVGCQQEVMVHIYLLLHLHLPSSLLRRFWTQTMKVFWKSCSLF